MTLLKKRVAFALTLFIFIGCIFGQFYKKWWFNGADDFHCLYLAYKTQTWQALGSFFYNGHPNRDAGPSNCIRTDTRTSFLNTYYRPIQLILSTLLYWIFGTNAEGFYIFNVFLHASNTGFIFFLLSSFASITTSCFGAILFAFHPQIAYRFGALANIQYYFGTLLILLMTLFFIRYINTHRLALIIPINILFFIALLTRETYIVIPIIFLIWSLLYKKYTPIIGLVFTTFFYVAIRLYLYPFSGNIQNFSIKQIFLLLNTKIQELFVCLYDCLWLSWLPWGNPLLRCISACFVIGVLIFLFIKSKKKIIALVSFFSGFLMLWPGVIGHYSPRYFYDSAPLIIVSYTILCTFYNDTLKKYRHYASTLFLIPCILLILFTTSSFTLRTKKMHTIKTALENILKNPYTNKKPLCFISYPDEVLGDQPAEICWVLRNDTITPVYCDSIGAIVQNNAHIVQSTRWYNQISSLYTENYLQITRVQNGFRYTSINPHKINFSFGIVNGFSLGKKVIHQTTMSNNHQVVTDFTLILENNYFNEKPMYLIWNYYTKKFDIY